MKLPKGYQRPELIWTVELWDDQEEHSLAQLGAFTTEEAATACRNQLEAEGRSNLVLNMIAVHARTEDWQFDR